MAGLDAPRRGKLLCALHTGEDTWLGERPYRSASAVVRDGRATCLLEGLPRGRRYAAGRSR